jgi:hypothetical protein
MYPSCVNSLMSCTSRRTFLQSVSAGFGYLAFAGMASAEGASASGGLLSPKKPHFAPRAKRILFLCMDGGPSHLDTFDFKPRLNQDDGKPIGVGRVPQGLVMKSPWKFKQHGDSGLWISELFPQLAKLADELCVVRSMQTEVPAHTQAFLAMHTGTAQFQRPSLGAWTLYGLGTENSDIPGFITIGPPVTNGGPTNYGSSFLPAIYQGTKLGAANKPLTPTAVSNLHRDSLTPDAQRLQLDYIQSLNRRALEREEQDAGIEGLIESYELAFRLQGRLPELMNIADETADTRKAYGLDDKQTELFGTQCLVARRLLESGVRFVEVTHSNWDQHNNLEELHGKNALATDRPMAALLEDLRQRGLLEDTVVVWGGEFGRTPYAQRGNGRDHNHRGYTFWMAGGGVRAGMAYGQTDEYGIEAVENPVSIHDWHATLLHLLGLDHTKLTYRYAGREMRLTDQEGVVVEGIL